MCLLRLKSPSFFFHRIFSCTKHNDSRCIIRFSFTSPQKFPNSLFTKTLTLTYGSFQQLVNTTVFILEKICSFRSSVNGKCTGKNHVINLCMTFFLFPNLSVSFWFYNTFGFFSLTTNPLVSSFQGPTITVLIRSFFYQIKPRLSLP